MSESVSSKTLIDSLIPPSKLRYWEALGRFVSFYTTTELTLQDALWHLAGVKPATAQAIFSGVRIESAMSTIRRFQEAQSWDEARRAEIEAIFKQLNDIREFRNWLLHYGAKHDSKDLYKIKNTASAHISKKIQTMPVSREILEHATTDLVAINSRIILFCYGDKMQPNIRASFETSRQRAWAYKHSKAREEV